MLFQTPGRQSPPLGQAAVALVMCVCGVCVVAKNAAELGVEASTMTDVPHVVAWCFRIFCSSEAWSGAWVVYSGGLRHQLLAAWVTLTAVFRLST